jgi:hypothetical protein
MIKVILNGKMNAEFIVKNPKKIEMWRMLEMVGEGRMVKIKTENLK